MVTQCEPQQSAEAPAQGAYKQTTSRTRRTRIHPRDPLKNLDKLPPLEFSEIDTSALENLAQSASAAPAPVARPPADGQPAETSPPTMSPTDRRGDLPIPTEKLPKPECADIDILSLDRLVAQSAPAAPAANHSPKGQPLATDATGPAEEPAKAPKLVTTEYLRKASTSAFFFGAAKKIFGDLVSPQVVQDFVDQLVAECEATGDPLEAFLVERAALLRFTGAFLHGASITCDRPQDQALINSAACQTSGEMRRVIMTLRDYRKDRGLDRSKPSKPVDANENATPGPSTGKQPAKE